MNISFYIDVKSRTTFTTMDTHCRVQHVHQKLNMWEKFVFFRPSEKERFWIEKIVLEKERSEINL